MANRRLAQLLRCSALEGRLLGDFLDESDRALLQVRLAGLGTGLGIEALTLRFRAEGLAFEGEVSVAAVAEDGNQPASLVIVVKDVTEQQQLRAQMAHSDRLASMGMLAAGVAHEINNPLSYIICNLEALSSQEH